MTLPVGRRLSALLAFSALLVTGLQASAQDVVADPASYNFFVVYVGESATTTPPMSLTNVNGGTVFITHAEWTYNPLGAFEVTSGLTIPAAIGSGESVDYEVTFTPPDFSFWNARLVFYTDSLTTPSVEVRFSGFGELPPTCTPPLPDLCGSVCVDLATDPTNCGTCGNVCDVPANGAATCEASVCGIQCDPDYVEENGACVSAIPLLPPAALALLATLLGGSGLLGLLVIRRRA